ncbi:MAG: NrtA/SsuA/CpmA family ABC transporter substrate-binding protein [Treponema sp.]|jgi:sulfonate transport system substrate-binding protein|nr:NrtA/SsuA/CpmA family ABC transporter substrate-binding protein [Treponema sp.]
MKVELFRDGKALWLVSAVFFLVAAGNGYAKAAKDQGAPGKPVTINLGDLSGYPLTKVALAQGFFKDEFEKDNITVAVHNFQAGPEEIEALAARSLDFASLGAQPALQGIANKVGIHVVSGLLNASDANGLIVRTDSGINSIADLKGKKVGVPVGTTSHLTLIRQLEKNGLSVQDIELVNLAAGNIPASILTGAIPAAVIFEPGLTGALVNGKGSIKKLDTATGYVRLIDVLVARDDFVKQHPDVAVRLLRVIKRTAIWYNEHSEESLEILTAFLGIDKEVIRPLLASMPPQLALKKEDKTSILETVQYLRKNGIITANVTAAQIFNDAFAKEAGIYDNGKGY